MRDMLGRENAVSVSEARKRIAGQMIIREPRKTTAPLEEAYKRVLAEDISSPEDLPSFSRSTVDGFAVKASDTFGATEGFPAYLETRHEIFMGEEPNFELQKSSLAKIPTGGMLPLGADAVVMLEHTQIVDEKMIEVLKPVAPGENVIAAGDDVRKGECILRKGSILRAQDVAALAGIGITSVAVYEKPVIAIISTGDEIVRAGSPIKKGQVRDVNSYNLAGLILDCGGIPYKKGVFRDNYTDIRAAAEECLKRSALVIITGGSSVGALDMTSEIIGSLGSPGVLFHGVALKPGKPTIGAVVDGIPLFGLPGHPAAVTICFELFIRPVLKQMTGRREKDFLTDTMTIPARIAKNISSVQGREEHIRVALEERNGEVWAVPVLGKSGLIRTLVIADGTVVIPPSVRGIEEGEVAEVILF